DLLGSHSELLGESCDDEPTCSRAHRLVAVERDHVDGLVVDDRLPAAVEDAAPQCRLVHDADAVVGGGGGGGGVRCHPEEPEAGEEGAEEEHHDDTDDGEPHPRALDHNPSANFALRPIGRRTTPMLPAATGGSRDTPARRALRLGACPSPTARSGTPRTR